MKQFDFSDQELLLAEVKRAKQTGKSLSHVFEKIATLTGRAKGSVRNIYYALMRDGKSQAVKQSGLSVKKQQPFTGAEEVRLVEGVLGLTLGGKSVRQAIISLSEGDDKLQLRMQNKFRNLVKTKPKLIAEVKNRLGIAVVLPNPKLKPETVLIKKLSAEIDGLMQRLKKQYALENENLKQENLQLRRLVDELNFQLKSNASKILRTIKVETK